MIRTALFLISFVWVIGAPSPVKADDCPRIITIGGAITEIVYALGQEHCLVGVDTTSTYPQETDKLPKVGYQRQLATEGILSLDPEIIFHTAHAGPPSVLKQLDQAGVKRVILSDAPTLDSVYAKIRGVAEAFTLAEKGETLISELQDAYTALNTAEADTHNVLFVMQHGGGAPMVAGTETAAHAIVTLAGGNNLADFDRYKPLTPEAMVTKNPSIIVTTTQSLNQIGGIDSFVKLPGINLTKAGRERRIIAMDALLLLGFGPRTVDAASQLSDHFKNL